MDSRTSPHRHVYDALLSQYLDEDDNNAAAATFAFPDHVFWTLTGTRCEVAFSEFDFALTTNDFEAILDYINHHYRVAHRRNKQSGLHSDFENFVGTRYFLFYYHLCLNEAPNLLNFAVAKLPSNAFQESYHVGASDNDDNGGGNNVSGTITSADKKARRKKDKDKNKAQKQLGCSGCISSGTVRKSRLKSTVSSSMSRTRFVRRIL